MGFYKSRDGGDFGHETRERKFSGIKWIATVVISALVGSGATLAMIPALQSNGVLNGLNLGVQTVQGSSQSTSSASGTAPVTTQVNVQVQDGITKVFKQVEPDVMGVVNYGQVTNYFSQSSQLQPQGVGTGVLFYKDSQYGYVVTNNHVVEGSSKVQAVLSSGKHVDATVVGTDPYTDLAVIKLPVSAVKGVTPVTFANSDDIQTGETAIAIGTPMGLDFADSITSGIVSAKSRMMPVQDPQSQETLDYQAVIQTDAAINPGNSGGPLLNLNGDVIGINSSKIVAQGFSGMGFAIPANEVQNIANQIMKTGHATHPSIGISGQSLSALSQFYMANVPVNYGVWVQSVTSKDAEQAGLKPNDVIVGLDGKTVQNIADLRTYLFQHRPGDTVSVVVYRGDKKLTLKMKLSEMSSPNTTAQGNSSSNGQNGQPPADPLNPFGPGQFGD